MKKYSNESLLYLGDIHGNFKFISYFCKTNNINNAIIVQVGDFGLGFEKEDIENKKLEYLNNYLFSNNILLISIRGNHDDPSYWSKQKLSYSNIILAQDYERIMLNDKVHLFIGGATSIDWMSRTLNRDYWSDEIITYNNDIQKELENMLDIDVVVSHAAPRYVYPFFSKNENNDREIMTDIFNILLDKNNIKEHYYGHYHDSKVSYIGETKHVLLGINEVKSSY